MRIFLSLSVIGLLCLGVGGPAGAVSDTAVAKILTPTQKRADELDRVFGKLKIGQDQAQRIWEIWTQSDSATADVILLQASRAMNDSDYDSALAVLDRMLKSYPDYAEAYDQRAMTYFMRENYDKALADIDRVLELEPRHFGALAGRGIILFEQDKKVEALKAFEQALAINPKMEAVQAAIKVLQHDMPGI